MVKDLRDRGYGAVGKSFGPASRRLVVRISAATDVCRKNVSDSTTAKRLAIGVRFTVTNTKGCPLS